MTEAATPTKQELAEAATKAKIAAKEQKLAEAKAKKEAADKARAEKAEARAKAQAEAKEKAEKAKAEAEAAKKAKAEERAAKAAEKAANPGTTLGTIVERAKGYIKGPNGQLHSGDELAMALESVPANKVVELILAIFKEPNKYAHLNYGQQSMNYRNRLRGAISKGLEIEGVKVTLDYVKQVRDDGGYVPSEEAETA